MKINSGTILISAPSLDDPNFEKVVIFIAEYNEKGALGFVVNKLFLRKLNDLVEFKDALPFPLFEGGPVENGNLFFLHQQPAFIKEGVPVIDSIYLGGDFKQVIKHLNDKKLQQNNLKLFIGYCGWDYNQLEEEVQEGSWLICNADKQTVFSTDTETVWEVLYNAHIIN